METKRIEVPGFFPAEFRSSASRLGYNGVVLAYLDLCVWKYPPATSEATLRAHYRIARRLVLAWTALAIATISACAEFVVSGGSSTFSLVFLAGASAVSLVLALPGLAAVFWAAEIEKELAARGLGRSRADSVERRVGRTAGKMVLWVAVLVLACMFRFHN